MSFFRDFLNLWHEWAATPWEAMTTDDSDHTEDFGDTENEKFVTTCDSHDDDFEWDSLDDPFEGILSYEAPLTINPITGPTMFYGPGGQDIAGNPYGLDFSGHDDSSAHDDWSDIHSDSTTDLSPMDHHDDWSASDPIQNGWVSGFGSDPWNG